MTATRGVLALALTLAAASPGSAAILLQYCGYIGGDGAELGAPGVGGHGGPAIAVDASGNAFVSGQTSSAEATFPAVVGPDLTYNGGDIDAFVAKVNPAGTGLVYAGYIGGSGDDDARDLALDGAGNAYLHGATTSTESSLPVVVGPDLTWNGNACGGVGYDAFVAKVNAAGTALVLAGYVGGDCDETGEGVAVDATGRADLIGTTSSAETSFPAAVGPDLTYSFGATDAFVARVRADGAGLDFAGYVGGSKIEFASAIAVDASSAAAIAGRTKSDSSTFPVLIGPALTLKGSGDVFVAKVTADGSGLAYAGYIGGGDVEYESDIALDSAANAYVTGSTPSDQATFPVRVGPDLTFNGTTLPRTYDGFVAKVSSGGQALLYAGYIGGDGFDTVRTVAVDGSGSAFVAGSTSSTEGTFPVAGGPDLTYNGGSEDAFLARVKPDGSGLVYAGYIGGAERDLASGIALDAGGTVYIAGEAASDQATFPVTVGPDLTANGNYDAFVAKIGEVSCVAAVVPIVRLRAVKAAGMLDDVALTWNPVPAANGYNIWYVRDKTDIDRARQASQPPAIGVLGCAAPMPAGGPACTDVGGVPRSAPSAFFYQVRAFCDAMNEGP